MKRKGFTIIEIIIVFLLILSVVFLVLPKSLHNTKHARLISKWAQKYSSLEYMFSVIKIQQEIQLKEKISNAKSAKDKKNALLTTLKPYLRITSELSEESKNYKQFFMNGKVVNIDSKYYFNNFYKTDSDEVIGLKWIDENCETPEKICAIISIDINGLTPPNVWGYDIFGIDIKKNSIEPLGKNSNPEMLKYNCDKKGEGTYCSYYYLIGGKFD